MRTVHHSQKGHVSDDCKALERVNKALCEDEFPPVTVTPSSGSVIFPTERVKLDADKEIRGLRGVTASLKARSKCFIYYMMILSSLPSLTNCSLTLS
jgi:hypothetical protein